jgi:hypothetical protein
MDNPETLEKTEGKAKQEWTIQRGYQHWARRQTKQNITQHTKLER